MKQKSIVALTLLISVLLLSPTFLSLSAATSTFGQTSVGNNSAWQSAGVLVGSRFTTSGGTPVSMSVYIAQSGSSSNTAKCAIYSESNKQLIAVTEEKTIPAGFNGWMTFNFGSSPSLASGSSYSLVVWFKNSASTVRYNSGNAAQTWYAIQSYTGNFPNGPYSNIGGYGQENNVYSLYCTLNSDVTSSPSPSPSPTSSPTQPTSSSTFGQTAQGNNAAWQPSNLMVGSRFTASSTGTLNSITVYITNGASTSNNVKCAVYSETNKALVASSQELTISGRASGWFTFPTTTSPIIDAGQRYSLVVWLQSANCYLPYASGSSSQSWYTQGSYGTFPSTYNTNGQENNVYSLYATIAPTGVIPQNPTQTQTPIPTSTPTPITAPQSATNGELYLWTGFWMTAGDNNAKRIAGARDTYGVNIWIDAGNYGGPHLTSSLINYFHAHGVKVVNRLWSDGGNVPLNTILHSSDTFGHSKGSIDYQLSIGPEIDAFMIDECDQWNHASYYEAIANYVHSKGKLLFVNTGTHNVETMTCTYADKISTEFSWYQFINSPQHASLIAAYPQKFIGVTKDYMYDINFVYCPPRSASGDRPAYTAPLSLSRASWETKTAWAGGVFCMAATPADHGYLPTWFEQYVAALS